MSNEVQELVQRDYGTDGEEETNPWLARTNWDENLLAPSGLTGRPAVPKFKFGGSFVASENQLG